MKHNKWLFLLLVPALAHADDIQTDRPDFVESSNTVGKGVLQIETSVSASRDKTDSIKVRELATPTLFRYGVSDNWEVRLETDGRMHQTVHDHSSSGTVRDSGYADYSLGLKWHQQDGDDKTMSPSVGWLFHLDMPGGSGEFRSHKVRPSVRGVAEWDLADDYSLGVMGGVTYGVNDNDDRYWAPILGVVAGKSFTEKLRGFVELAAEEIRRDKDGGSQIALDTGVAYLVSDDVQVDAILSRGLNEFTADYAVGFGLSMRF